MIFKPRTEQDFSFINEFDVKVTDLTNLEHITNVIIKVNGDTKFNGTIITGQDQFVINAGDTVFISVTKDFYKTCKMQINGFLL
jgi:hypothetical protein